MTLWQQEMAWRNRPLTDDELDQILPAGYRIVVPPESYVCFDRCLGYFLMSRSPRYNVITISWRPLPPWLPLVLIWGIRLRVRCMV